MDLSFRGHAVGAPDGLRRALVRATWGTNELPALLPTSVTKFYAGTTYKSSYAAARADLLVCPLPRGGVSNVHLIYPNSPIGRVAILHGGHGTHYYDNFGFGMEIMSQVLVNAGYHLVGVCMPLSGFNPSPLILNKAAGGTMSLSGHDAFYTAEDDGVATLRLFLDPVIAAVNHVVAELNPTTIDMTGLSGGGWTTDWAAALIRGIRRSVPVYGSLPFSLRPPGDVGDYEQSKIRAFWDPARTGQKLGLEETLYALGGTGSTPKGGPRRRVQILGTNDPVFPVTTIPNQVAAYNAAIQLAVGSDNADVFIATTTIHSYDSAVAAKVLEVFAA